jgi:hypothetical protein
MTTPEAALAAALQHIAAIRFANTDEQSAAILAALDGRGWSLVNDEDFHAELTDDEVAVVAAMNFGEGLIEGRKQAADAVPDAEKARWRAALEIIAAEPTIATFAVGVTARNIARAALAAPTEEER